MTDPSHDHAHDTRRETSGHDDLSDHWLVRPATIRKLWWIFAAILATTIVAQFFIHVHGYFTVDGWTGFNALYGFLTCVGMVVFAKLLGLLLKRSDDYYEIKPRLSPDIDSPDMGDAGHTESEARAGENKNA